MSMLIESSAKKTPGDASPRSSRLLLVAYNFPPVGGAGVQRPVKWVKHLCKLGWDVTVLTTENPSVPTRDESLLADIPDDVPVIRARTWEPDYRAKQKLVHAATSGADGLIDRGRFAIKTLVKQFVKLALQPDPQILWVPNAIRAGKRLLRELSHDAILVTAPPYSSFFIGASLKQQFGLPLILDFRDEWDLSGRYLENASRDRLSQGVQTWMQKYLLKQADAVVATTMASTAHLGEKLARLKRQATRLATIYNGFDEDDFESVPRANDSVIEPDPACRNKFRLIYTGTLWNLTTIEPLVSAILRLNETAPELISRLELVCVGRKTPEQTSILERIRHTGCHLELIDYCEHAKVLEWLRTSDAVCLLLSDVVGAERVVPAKLFEYLATRKEMLAIVPPGETAQIVQQFHPQSHLAPSDVEGIAGWLKRRLGAEKQVQIEMVGQSDINHYSRATQTKQLVDLLNELVASNTHPARAPR